MQTHTTCTDGACYLAKKDASALKKVGWSFEGSNAAGSFKSGLFKIKMKKGGWAGTSGDLCLDLPGVCVCGG